MSGRADRRAARTGRAAIAPTSILVLAMTLIAAACAEASAQIVTPDDGTLSFEIPVEYAELDDTAGGVRSFGTPGSSAGGYGSDPIVSVLATDGGETASYLSLRSLPVGGRFDPVETEDPTEQAMAELLGYIEIGEPDVWGIRVRLLLESGISDFQALVDRRTDQITLSEVHCTRACFAEQADVIDRIQRSWSLDP
jgi:hypothetical protein